jgi:hypothetical protein
MAKLCCGWSCPPPPILPSFLSNEDIKSELQKGKMFAFLGFVDKREFLVLPQLVSFLTFTLSYVRPCF